MATYRHGNPVMIDYTPASGNVSAGDIIIIGNTAGLTNVVAHSDIANNVQGAVGAGGGVYDCPVAGNYARGTKVYVTPANTAANLTSTSTNNSLFGFTLETASGANDVVKVLHEPYV